MTSSTKPTLDHAHGTPGNRCGHPVCRAATQRYNKRWRYERSHGRKRVVPVDDTRRHVDTLLGLRWSMRSIAGEAGVGVTSVYRVTKSETTHINGRIAAAILAVDPGKVAGRPSLGTDDVFVPRVGTTRRIQALLVLGWTHAEQHARSGVRTAILLSQPGDWVTRSTHDKVGALYRDLSQRQGPSERTRARARHFGYASPLAWNDIDLDEAPETSELEVDLDETAIERRLEGDKSVRLTKAEAAETVSRWRESGRTWADFERTTGINVDRYPAAKRGPIDPTTDVQEDLAS